MKAVVSYTTPNSKILWKHRPVVQNHILWKYYEDGGQLYSTVNCDDIMKIVASCTTLQIVIKVETRLPGAVQQPLRLFLIV